MEKVSIFGLGRVGLPLALSFAEADCRVIGVDIDKEKLGGLEKGLVPFMEEGAEELLKRHIGKNLTVTSDSAHAVKNSDYLVLTLGTPVDEHLNPTFSQIDSVLEESKPSLREGQTMILRSTVSPGTTEYVARAIERDTNLRIGEDFYLAFCPERIAEGKAIEEIKSLPQIVGSLDPKSAEKAANLFGRLTPTILQTSARAAELTKLYCNMYRYINFAIANEFMMIAEQNGASIHEITKLVNSGYKRGGLASPGLAAGPCLYKDGFFLINSAEFPFSDLITTAWRINEGTPDYIIGQIRKRRDLRGEKVAILGKSFKRDIDDTRNSLSYRAKKIFRAAGSDVHMHDPHVKSESLEGVLDNAGIVFVAVNHSAYQNMGGVPYLRQHVKQDCLVADIWNIYKTNKVIFDIKGEK